MTEKTIAAISTPLGEGGIGVIRISGENAPNIAERCFRAFSGESLCSLAGYHAAYGELFDTDGVIDDCVALVFKAPKSYTGENTVEFSLHGGRGVVRRALRAVLSCGAVAAERGEFTKRAFLNGKLDLAKAESIMGLISADNDTALKISRGVREGRIGRETEAISAKLLETAASLSAFADYPDEDISGLSKENFTALLEECSNRLSSLLSSYDAGRAVREGIDCAIVGKPNVGKSTLMNLLCGSERSIVTDIAGTTRDIIENTVRLGDITLNLADTAGIHDTADTVELMGVSRARSRLEASGIILAVFDISSPLDSDDLSLIKSLHGKAAVVILNKTDLGSSADLSPFEGLQTVEISAKSGEGLEALTEKIADITAVSRLDPDAAVLISERQRDCATRAYDAVSEALSAINAGVTLDAVGVCIDDAIAALLELTGKRVTNEVTDEVFRRFCVGK